MDDILLRLNQQAFLRNSSHKSSDFCIKWSYNTNAFCEIWQLSSTSVNRTYRIGVDKNIKQALLLPSITSNSTLGPLLEINDNSSNELEDTNAIGVCIASKNVDNNGKDVGYIQALKIRKGWLGMGLSKLILYEVIVELFDIGYEDIYLLVACDNIIAINLYQSFGFQPIIESIDEQQQWNDITCSALQQQQQQRKLLITKPIFAIESFDLISTIKLRIEELERNNDLFLVEASQYFAVCGLAAFIYSLLKTNNLYHFYLHYLLPKINETTTTVVTSYQLFFMNKYQSLYTNSLINETSLDRYNCLPIYCDMVLCWLLRSLFQETYSESFQEQEAFSSTFEIKLKPTIAFSMQYGDMCFTPSAMVLLSKLNKSFEIMMSIPITTAEDFDTTISTYLPSEDNTININDNNYDDPNTCRASDDDGDARAKKEKNGFIMFIGKGVEGVNEAVNLSNQTTTSSSSRRTRELSELDHWFVVTDFKVSSHSLPTTIPPPPSSISSSSSSSLSPPSSSTASSQHVPLPNRGIYSGDVWNFTGNGGSTFKLINEPSLVWFQDLDIVHVICLRI